MPFGRGKRSARNGVWNALFGGFQVAATFEWQLGPLLDWLNLFNRSQFSAPVTNPISTDFGKVVAEEATTKQFFQIQARIRY